eukprot:4820547-Prymnesium_polylepis.1
MRARTRAVEQIWTRITYIKYECTFLACACECGMSRAMLRRSRAYRRGNMALGGRSVASRYFWGSNPMDA